MKLCVSSLITINDTCVVEVEGDTRQEILENASLAFRKQAEEKYGWVDFDSVFIQDNEDEDDEGVWY